MSPKAIHRSDVRFVPSTHLSCVKRKQEMVRGNGNSVFPNHRARLVGRRHAANPPLFAPGTQVCLYASATYQRYVITPSSHHRTNQSPYRPRRRRQSHHSLGKLGRRTDATQPRVHLLRWVCASFSHCISASLRTPQRFRIHDTKWAMSHF